MSSGPSRPAPDGAFRNSPAVAAAARVGRHRVPAAGPPPLRLHDPVRTRLLAGGERRQISVDGNRWAMFTLTKQTRGRIQEGTGGPHETLRSDLHRRPGFP